MYPRRSVFAKSPAWVQSVATATISLIIPFLIAGVALLLGKFIGFSGRGLREFCELGNSVGYHCTGIFVAIMCFLICKAHPKSIWYSPIICNGVTLWIGLSNYMNGNLLLNELFLTFGIGLILSFITSILGTIVGRHAITEETMF